MKKISIVVVCVLMSFLVSCNSQISMTPEQRVLEQLETMQNYEAEMDVTFTNNTKTATMKMKQVYYADGAYEMTLIEPESLKGYKTTYDGQVIEEYNPLEDKKVQAQANPVKNQVLFGTFVHNYLHGEVKQPLEVEEETLTVAIAIPGNYKYMATQQVWFDMQTGCPIKVAIYDKEGKATITTLITAFQYNKEIK